MGGACAHSSRSVAMIHTVAQVGSPVKHSMGGAVEASRSLRARMTPGAQEQSHADAATGAAIAAAAAAADALANDSNTATGVHIEEIIILPYSSCLCGLAENCILHSRTQQDFFFDYCSNSCGRKNRNLETLRKAAKTPIPINNIAKFTCSGAEHKEKTAAEGVFTAAPTRSSSKSGAFEKKTGFTPVPGARSEASPAATPPKVASRSQLSESLSNMAAAATSACLLPFVFGYFWFRFLMYTLAGFLMAR